jgi:excisionase family DNA binding protein
MNDEYLSVPQVAQLKGVSRSAVYKAVQEARLASVRLVGHTAIKRADAVAWVPGTRMGRRQGQVVSEQTKAKISASQRLRWQKRKEK